MSFKLKKEWGAPMEETVIIDNSDVVTIGDLVQCRNGNLELATAGAAVRGVVTGIKDKNGISVWNTLATLGTATKTGSPSSGSVTVASDNETVDLISAVINVSPFAIYSATVTGTMNTTNASNKRGGWVNVDDEDSVNETTHSRTITDVRTLNNWGVDPDDSTRMLVSIKHSEIFGDGTAQA